MDQDRNGAGRRARPRREQAVPAAPLPAPGRDRGREAGVVLGLLAANCRLLEDTLYRVRKLELGEREETRPLDRGAM